MYKKKKNSTTIFISAHILAMATKNKTHEHIVLKYLSFLFVFISIIIIIIIAKSCGDCEWSE